jgi:uncharacterized RDD family membrane protein YckC
LNLDTLGFGFVQAPHSSITSYSSQRQLVIELLVYLLFHPAKFGDAPPSYIGVIYYLVLTKAYGQTYGKKWLGIKVVRIDGKPLTYWGVFLREVLGKFASTLILGIGFFMAAFRKDKRALHDLAAKTIVVYQT